MMRYILALVAIGLSVPINAVVPLNLSAGEAGLTAGRRNLVLRCGSMFWV